MEKNKKVFMIGNAHIDAVWLWQWQEGYQEIKATFQSALDRMKEYKEFIFTGSSAAYYEWVEENAPSMFEEIKERVREGRWVIVGGWWVQPDCNTPCGESFVRQGLYGQRYFQEKFGVKAVCGYNVDSFGHNGMLPQILKKSGMEYYVFMRPGRHEKGMEGETFLWKSPDGSSVKAFRIPFEYCTWPEEIEKHVKRCSGEIKDEENSIMCFYGVGNHGGGPTKQNIESIREMSQREDMPQLIMASCNDYFEEVEKSARNLPVVSGELLHHASGCYSAHAILKAMNRKAENQLEKAEKMSCIANVILDCRYPKADYTDAWKNILFNQFHDTLAGSVLEEACNDAIESYGASLHTSAKGLNAAIQALSWQIQIPMEEGMKPIVVFNPHSFETQCEIQMESVQLKENTVLLDEEGVEIPYQLIQSQASSMGRCRIAFIADLPSMGWRTYRLAIREEQKRFTLVSSSDIFAENKWIRISFNKETGYITSLLKKNDNTEFFEAPAAVPIVMEDKSDTWSHGVFRFQTELGKFSAVEVKRVESGPVKSVIRVISEYGKSRLIQDFSIYKELPYIQVKTTLDWKEERAMLKLNFPINMNYLRATWEIPYGVSQREPNGEEFPMQGFVDVEGSNPGMETMMNGVTFINDGKTSASICGKNVSLTLARSPIYAHHDPYIPKEELEYVYMDQGIQTFTYAMYPHDGNWENTNSVHVSKLMNQKPIAIFETYHQGILEQRDSFLTIDQDNVIVSNMKAAEDNSGDLILRIYETAGRKTCATLNIPVLDQTIKIDITAFEIKTLRLSSEKGAEVKWNNLLEEL